MSGMFAAAAAGVRTIGLQTPECGIAELWRCWIVTRRVAKLPECEAVGPRTFGMKRRRSTEPLGSEPPECSIAELWRCWIVTHRAAKLPECGAAAKRVERPAPGAVSSGRDADAPSRLPLPGHKCSPSFFSGGGDTLRAVPGRIRALHNPFWPDSRSSQPAPGRIRALHNPLPGLIHTPPEPFPPPGTPAARLRNPIPRAAKPQGLRFGRRIARAEMQRGSEAGNSDRRSTKPPWHRPVWDRFGRSGSDRPAAGENRTPHAADNPDAGASNRDGRDDPAKALRQPSVVSTTCR